jgi:hypothetical protein
MTLCSSSKEDDNWQDKLSEANAEDYYEIVGKFERRQFNDEFNYKNKFNESYDQWADRIFSEFRKRRQPAEAANKQKQQPPKELKLKLANPKLERYNKLASKLFDKNSTDEILPESLPFKLTTSTETIVELLIISTSGDEKKAVKEAIRKYHPDKFSQLFHDRIAPENKEAVFNIVTHVSQALLNYGK